MRIYACLTDDVSDGFVWLSNPGLPSRAVVKITNPENGRSIHCETLQFDDNFVRVYNESPSRINLDRRETSIVMSGWYRALLGNLETQTDYPLSVVVANGVAGKILACTCHPQVVIRVAVWLGIVSVALGVVSFVLGLISLCS